MDNKTQQDNEDGLAKYGNFGCAKCGSQNSQPMGTRREGGRNYQHFKCGDCGHTWKKQTTP